MTSSALVSHCPPQFGEVVCVPGLPVGLGEDDHEVPGVTAIRVLSASRVDLTGPQSTLPLVEEPSLDLLGGVLCHRGTGHIGTLPARTRHSTDSGRRVLPRFPSPLPKVLPGPGQ